MSGRATDEIDCPRGYALCGAVRRRRWPVVTVLTAMTFSAAGATPGLQRATAAPSSPVVSTRPDDGDSGCVRTHPCDSARVVHRTLLETRAAAIIAADRARRRKIAHALRQARLIARRVGVRYRLPDGQTMTVREVGPLVQLGSIAVAGSLPGHFAAVFTGTRHGLYYDICGHGSADDCRYQGPSSFRDHSLLPRREALELALRTFQATDARLVFSYLPMPPGGHEIMIVFTRPSPGTPNREAGTLLHALERNLPAAIYRQPNLRRRVLNATRLNAFTLFGLTDTATPDGADSLLVVPTTEPELDGNPLPPAAA